MRVLKRSGSFEDVSFDKIIERFKKQWEDRKNQQKSLDSRISVIEEKLDKLMNHLGVK